MLAPQRFFVLGGFGAFVLLALVYYSFHGDGYSINDLARLRSTYADTGSPLPQRS